MDIGCSRRAGARAKHARAGAAAWPGISLAGLALAGLSLAGAPLARPAFVPSAALQAAAGGPADARGPQGAEAKVGDGPQSLEETRLALGKWIETQQIISKEQLEWQQGREILTGRLDLVQQEVATLEGKIREAEAALAAGEEKRAALAAEDLELTGRLGRLAEAAAGLESRVTFLLGSLPLPVRERIAPLAQRIPERPAETKVSPAERFQNVLGILNEVDKANSEISVAFEVRTLSDGKRSEVRALYVGLGAAYYVSASGEAGIGRPSSEGWNWEPADALASDILQALDILQGKHTPAFVPLPARLQ